MFVTPWLHREPVPDVFTFGPDWKTNVRQALVYHSPDGLSWGYCGSGPLDTSLNIVALFMPPQTSLDLYHLFCKEVVALIPQDQSSELPAESVRAWLLAHIQIRSPGIGEGS